MCLVIRRLFLVLFLIIGRCNPFCVLDTKKGWKLDCGLRDSYLFRIKEFGGIHANFDVGFGVGDEKGFPNSISRSEYKDKHGKHPPKSHQSYPTNSYNNHYQNHPTHAQQNYLYPQHEPYYGGHSQQYQYSPYRRNIQNVRARNPPRVNDFPYKYELPSSRRKKSPKKPKKQGFFSRLFGWGNPKKEEKEESRPRQKLQRTYYQQRRAQQHYQQQQQYQLQRQQQNFQERRFAPPSNPTNTLMPPSVPQHPTQFVRATNHISPHVPLPPPPSSRSDGGPSSFFRVFDHPTTVAPQVTVGPSMGSLLKVPSHMKASTDNVPSFAAKLLIIREAPAEFYPPGYREKERRLGLSVQIPRTKFYCEEQKFLPGIYSDSQLGCKIFHLCVPSSVGSKMTSYLCPNGTLFDQSILQCNYWYNVDCESSINDYDSNLALSTSYRRINAAYLPIHAVTDNNVLSLLSPKTPQNKAKKAMSSRRMGRVLNFVYNEENDSNDKIDNVKEKINNDKEFINKKNETLSAINKTDS